MTKAVTKQANADHARAQKKAEARPALATPRSQSVPAFNSPQLQRKAACACGGGCPRCQRAKAAKANGPEPAVAGLVQEAGASVGVPLPAALQQRFGAGLGVDLSGVRVHTGAASMRAAEAVAAKAYTTGQDIHFAAGQYEPTTAAGQHLLAHEVVHTVQQGGRPVMQTQLEVSQPGDAFELEAERVAAAVLAGSGQQRVTTHVQSGTQRLARQPAGTDAPAESNPVAGTAGKASEDKGEVKPSAILPFKGKLPGETGWDGDAILQASQIDRASEVGKAIAQGTEEVQAISQRQAEQAAKEMVAEPLPDQYWAALMKAAFTCMGFGIGITLLNATYAELHNFAAVSPIIAKPGNQKKAELVAWSNPPVNNQPAQAAPAAAPVATPNATPAAAGTERQQLRTKATQEVSDVMGASYKAQAGSDEKARWEKFYGKGNIEELRKTDPNYTTCGALPNYVLNKLELVPDQGLMSGGLGGVRDGIPIMVTDDKDPEKKKKIQLVKKNTPENLAQVKASYGADAWIDDDGKVYKAGARHLGVWVVNKDKAQPEPGDIYMLEGVINSNEVNDPVKKAKPQIGIRHIGVIKRITDVDENTQTWVTGDAGQGSGVDQKAIESTRTYNKTTHRVSGGAEDEKRPELLPVVVGWVSLSKVKLLSELTLADRVQYVNNRLSETFKRGGSPFVRDAIMKIFASAPVSERTQIYAQVEGHAWTGDFKTDKAGVDKLFIVMDEADWDKIKETQERKALQIKVNKRRAELKQLLNEKEALST